MKEGHIKVPDYVNDTNPPSLWTYYETLPRWARNDPVVRNVVMAFEYHQPHLGIRQKEDALNMACSFLRPIEPTLKKVLADAILSQKVQMNMKRGQQMLNELQFYEMDLDWLGSESDDVESADEDTQDVDRILRLSKQADEEVELNPMESALSALSEDYRRNDMMKAAEQEMSINDYQVEPASNLCMTDFHTKEYPEGHEIEARTVGDVEFGVAAEQLPLNYYDNDDGFWDAYIKQKQERGARAGLITNRKHFIH